ncbi:hypothetical protein GN316_19410 [Xylophilus sp. Kf1]|nr:hypothetical protein [Xylophilus sp. Kf1]
MILKFLPVSKNSDPVSAVRYCSGEYDSAGILREDVQVIRGCPELFVQTTAGLAFSETYKSAVLGFAPEDVVTDADLQGVLDDFERVAFAGLNVERFCLVAYLHRSVTRTDVHILVSNVDCCTGKHFNIAPPGWKHSYDPLRDMWNWRKGWARPDDPRRARDLQPGSKPIWDAQRVRDGLKVEPNTKQLLTDFLLARIEAGMVKSRVDVLTALRELGEINREGDDYISVRLPEISRPIRLKGALFSKTFDVSVFNSAALKPMPSTTKQNTEIDLEKAEEAEALFSKSVFRRAQENIRRYGIKPLFIETSVSGDEVAEKPIDIILKVPNTSLADLNVGDPGGVANVELSTPVENIIGLSSLNIGEAHERTGSVFAKLHRNFGERLRGIYAKCTNAISQFVTGIIEQGRVEEVAIRADAERAARAANARRALESQVSKLKARAGARIRAKRLP